jgi:hypothetical protein
MTFNRIPLTISPSLEIEILSMNDIEGLFEFFQACKSLCEQFKHDVLLIFPIELESIFRANPLWKSFLDEINDDSQSNVLFTSLERSRCPLANPTHIFLSSIGYDYLVSPKYIISLLLQNRLPILVDHESRVETKNESNFCGNPEPCSPLIEWATLNLLSANTESMKTKLKELDNKWNVHFRLNQPTLEQIQYGAFLQAFFCDIPEKEAKNALEMDCIPSFIQDVSKCSFADMEQISFSAFRCITYPSSQDRQNKVKYSIDWHFNSPKQRKNVELKRCDVLDREETGIKVSRRKRLLVGILDQKKYLLAYDDDHDFSQTIINKRVDELLALLAERKKKEKEEEAKRKNEALHR